MGVGAGLFVRSYFTHFLALWEWLVLGPCKRQGLEEVLTAKDFEQGLPMLLFCL